MKTNKIISACLALCLVGSAVPLANVANAINYDELTGMYFEPWITYDANTKTVHVSEENTIAYSTWTFDEKTGTLTISGTGEMTNSPWEAYIKDIKTVVIEEGVTSISDFAFEGCSNLTSVTIPNTVTSIGDSAFEECYKLTSVTIPESVKYIGKSAFFDCVSLASITIPNGVTNIEPATFYNCNSLTSIEIPDSVVSVGNAAFYNCSSLTSIIFPKSVTSIGYMILDSISDITILNPNCEIVDYVYGDGEGHTIHGYPNSTAQTYAEKHDCKFEPIGEVPQNILGDLNGDGDLTVSDLIAFNQKLGKREALPKNCDLNGDGIVNVIDLALLKRALLNK